MGRRARASLLAVAIGGLIAGISPPVQARPPAPRNASGETKTPRVWPIVVGALIFLPTYGVAVYEAASGDAGKYGPNGAQRFGSPGWLYVPLVGPLIFDNTFCDDATSYYRDHPAGDEPGEACGGSGWGPVALLQTVGAAFIVSGFAFPVRHAQRQASTWMATPFASRTALGAHAVVSF